MREGNSRNSRATSLHVAPRNHRVGVLPASSSPRSAHFPAPAWQGTLTYRSSKLRVGGQPYGFSNFCDVVCAGSALALSACITTSMQGYADLQPPPSPIQHIAAIAPPALIPALAKEASKRGVVLEDANVILPRTRQYNEKEVRGAMAAHGVDGVLVVKVTGDTGVQQQYAGTIANTSYSGTSSGNALIGQHDLRYGRVFRNNHDHGDADLQVQPRHRFPSSPF